MRTAGVEVAFADAHRTRTGEGVVDCLSESDMKRAIEKLDGLDINGRKIRLVDDRPGGSRSRKSYTRSRSRSGSRSHSRSSSSRSRSRTPPRKTSQRRSSSDKDDD